LPILNRFRNWRRVLVDPPNDPLKALEAAEARRRFHQLGTAAVLGMGIVLALLVWWIPKHFHDPQEARVIMLAFISGPLAIGLSVPIMRRLSREEKARVRAVRQKECELRGEAPRMSAEDSVDFRKESEEPVERISPAEKAEEKGPTPPAAPDRLLLSYVSLRNADLRDEDLRGAVLRGADLRGARLDSANLSGADLSDSRLEGASLDGVIYDEATIWPASIDRRALETIGPEAAPEKGSDAG
jgi:hypothetical protein